MATAKAGTAPVNSPTRKRSDENQRSSNSVRFSPTTRNGGYYDHESQRSASQDALAPLDAVPTNTNAVADFDALLASLESNDEEELSIEDKIRTIGEARAVPSVLLETSPNRGLDDAEVLSRRKKYGWNMMKEEHRSHLKTFLMFFVGPIQCVMLVGWDTYLSSRFPLDT